MKVADRAEAIRVFNYPYAALEEAIVNAVYHRSYELREPIEVRIHRDKIEIASYPGPDPSIKIETLQSKRFLSRRYRNRRIGDFLKELDLTEGRGTGIPKICAALEVNGSPPPRFETDESRAYFLVELPVHPAFMNEAYDDLTETEKAILKICENGPKSNPEIIKALGYDSLTGNVKKALSRLTNLEMIEFTIPDKPRSKNQKRRITESWATCS